MGDDWRNPFLGLAVALGVALAACGGLALVLWLAGLG